MSDRHDNPPGLKWITVLGLAGFLAGFVGPMLLAPDANLGPAVGIFITGPAGVALGALLWGLCALLKPAARTQWRLLYSVATLGVLATLLSIRPEPKWLGYVFEGRVQSCARPSALEADVLGYWHKRIAEVNWAQPRAGWENDMRRTLSRAPGAVVSVRLERRNAIRQNRLLWNREEFASGWQPHDDDMFFYLENGNCAEFPAGRDIRGYQNLDYDGRPVDVEAWPPPELLRVLRAAEFDDIPERWRNL
ncbi:MAG TPA: hypothetical protein VNM24_07145 [Burkholderiales bacterium]|jgi:hypothetical protein|nr:hypothetical protein [Burkholderiales bacterium]